MPKIDLLAIVAHPDDAELGCGGTLIKHAHLGYSTGIVDLTEGEMSTRGDVPTRHEEARRASSLLGLTVRENLGLPDVFFSVSQSDLYPVIVAIRRYTPKIILTNARYDRHPDHGRAAELVFQASFYAGLTKIQTTWKNSPQSPWRPLALYHFIQSTYIQPHFVVDISAHWSQKIKAIKAFSSQFDNLTTTSPETYISSPSFFHMLESRALDWGKTIGTTHGEGFTTRRSPGVDDLLSMK